MGMLRKKQEETKPAEFNASADAFPTLGGTGPKPVESKVAGSVWGRKPEATEVKKPVKTAPPPAKVPEKKDGWKDESADDWDDSDSDGSKEEWEKRDFTGNDDESSEDEWEQHISKTKTQPNKPAPKADNISNSSDDSWDDDEDDKKTKPKTQNKGTVQKSAELLAIEQEEREFMAKKEKEAQQKKEREEKKKK